MATRLFTRSLLTTKQTLSSVLSRSYTPGSLSTPSSSLSSLSILRLRPFVALAANFHRLSPGATTVRGYATRRTSSSLNDPNPNWSNRPPKETILLDGCDFEHWLVVMEKPEGDPTRDDIIESYIKTLAEVVGSEDEARMKIYSVSTRHYFAFGALVSEELSYKLKELPRVRWVLPDSYLDVRNKDYGGEPFINGQAVPYDPKYHEEWVRNNAKANDRNRRNDRPRNFDRSRNFERRRENMQNPSGMASPPPGNMGGQPIMGGMPQTNMGGGMPPHNMGGGPPPHMGGGPPPYNVGGGPPPHNMGAAQPPPPHNMGAAQPPYNMGGGQPPYNVGGAPPPHNMGGGQPPHNMGGGQPPYNVGGAPPPYVGGGQPPHNMGGGMPQNNMGGNPQYNTGRTPQNNMGGPPNPMGVPPNNMGGPPNPVGGGLRNTAPPNFQYGPNSGGMPPQNREMSGPGQNREYQHNNFAPNMNPNQTQDMPGRDMPPPPNYQ